MQLIKPLPVYTCALILLSGNLGAIHVVSISVMNILVLISHGLDE